MQKTTFFLHNSIIELNYSALEHNALQYKTILGNDATIAMVIKGNAYGHGMHEIAKMADLIKSIDMLCTFSLSEAIYIRAFGITKPIIVMGHINNPCQEAAHKNIQFMVSSYEQLEELNNAGIETGYRFQIHIKFDTGLSRFGFYPDEFETVWNRCKTMTGIEVIGICTHLAEKNNLNSLFSQQQLSTFFSLLSSIKSAISYIHATTTTDALLFEKNACNLFRIGVGLYGYLPSKEIELEIKKRFPLFNLRPVITWKAPIIAIKELSPGTSIGYDRTYIAEKQMRIGILPIGYADGFSNPLMKHNTVYHNNAPLSIVGVVPMNTMMIDITNHAEISLHTQITVFNQTVSDYIITHRAENNWNIRAILCGIGRHIPRIVTQTELAITAAAFDPSVLHVDQQSPALCANPCRQKMHPLKALDEENF